MEKRKGGMRKGEEVEKNECFLPEKDANILENEQGKWAI